MAAPALTLAQHASAMFYGGSSGAVRYFASDYIAQQQAHLSTPDCEKKEKFSFDYRRGEEEGEGGARRGIRVNPKREVVAHVVVNPKRGGVAHVVVIPCGELIVAPHPSLRQHN